MTTSAQTLLPSETLRLLGNVRFTPKRLRAGAWHGERRSHKRGESIEFADYRDYSPGDDLRKLDWNILARHDKPVVKVYEDEQDLTVHLLLDASKSMGALPNTDERHSKWAFAARLAGALGYVALRTGDALTAQRLGGIGAFGGRGRENVVPFLRWLAPQTTEGETTLNDALNAFALREKRAGLCFLLSDCFSPQGYEAGLRALLARGHEVVFIHLLAPYDVHPPLEGDLRLQDVETNATRELSINDSLLARYQAHLREWQASLRATCARLGVGYALALSDTAPDRFMLSQLYTLGVLG
jgi:uncharacterized protein (DUF58 family)